MPLSFADYQKGLAGARGAYETRATGELTEKRKQDLIRRYGSVEQYQETIGRIGKAIGAEETTLQKARGRTGRVGFSRYIGKYFPAQRFGARFHRTKAGQIAMPSGAPLAASILKQLQSGNKADVRTAQNLIRGMGSRMLRGGPFARGAGGYTSYLQELVRQTEEAQRLGTARGAYAKEAALGAGVELKDLGEFEESDEYKKYIELFGQAPPEPIAEQNPFSRTSYGSRNTRNNPAAKTSHGSHNTGRLPSGRLPMVKTRGASGGRGLGTVGPGMQDLRESARSGGRTNPLTSATGLPMDALSEAFGAGSFARGTTLPGGRSGIQKLAEVSGRRFRPQTPSSPARPQAASLEGFAGRFDVPQDPRDSFREGSPTRDGVPFGADQGFGREPTAPPTGPEDIPGGREETTSESSLERIITIVNNQRDKEFERAESVRDGEIKRIEAERNKAESKFKKDITAAQKKELQRLAASGYLRTTGKGKELLTSQKLRSDLLEDFRGQLQEGVDELNSQFETSRRGILSDFEDAMSSAENNYASSLTKIEEERMRISEKESDRQIKAQEKLEKNAFDFWETVQSATDAIEASPESIGLVARQLASDFRFAGMSQRDIDDAVDSIMELAERITRENISVVEARERSNIKRPKGALTREERIAKLPRGAQVAIQQYPNLDSLRNAFDKGKIDEDQITEADVRAALNFLELEGGGEGGVQEEEDRSFLQRLFGGGGLE